MIGLIDPPRDNIKDVVVTLKEAKIRVMIVTGDFQHTAIAIGKQVGILTNTEYDGLANIITKEIPNDIENRSLVLNGSELYGLSKNEWANIVKYKEVIFSRVTPDLKKQIVMEYREASNIVAVTGDGVNDAPALKNAHMGIAMNASDLAIEAAEMILLDNNFASILTGITLGRLVFNNLRKVIIYAQTAGEFSEIIPVFANIFFGVPMPLSSFQMIVICMMTDVGPMLSLTEEEPESDLLRQPARKFDNHLVTANLMAQSFAFIGLYEALSAHFLFFWYLKRYAGLGFGAVFFAFGNWQEGYMGYSMNQLNEFNNVGQSVYFCSLVIMQAFGCVWACRTLTLSLFQQNPLWGKSKNLWIFVAMLASVSIMLIVNYLPFFNVFMLTRPIPVEFYFLSLAFAIGIIVLDEIRKFLKRNKYLGFQHTI